MLLGNVKEAKASQLLKESAPRYVTVCGITRLSNDLHCQKARLSMVFNPSFKVRFTSPELQKDQLPNVSTVEGNTISVKLLHP